MSVELASRHDAVSDELVRQVADEAEAAEKSVLRRLLSLRVRGRSAARIDRALRERGIEPR